MGAFASSKVSFLNEINPSHLIVYRFGSENSERILFKMQRTTLRLCIWGALLVACWAQQAAQLLQNPCFSKTTCSDCVRTASCAWCFARDFNGPRCFNPAMEGGLAGCDEAFIFNPDNQRSIDPAFNKELSRG